MTIVRVAGLHLVIFVDDHEPPHVHVLGDGETKIELGDSPETIKVVFSAGATAGERRKAERAVRNNHALLVKRWSELHG